MLYRTLALSALLLTAACANDQHRAAVAAAQRTCEMQFPNKAAGYDACVSQLEQDLEIARNQRSEPVGAAPQSQRNARRSGGSH